MTQELFEEITNSRSSWAIWPDEEVESYREFFIENISRLNPNVIFLGLNRFGGKKNRSGNEGIADCSNFHKRGHRGDAFHKNEIPRLEKLSGGFMTDIVSEIESFSSKVVSNQEEIDRFIDTLVKFNKEEITIICFGDKCYKFLNDRLIEGTKSKQENIGLLHHRTSYKNVNLNIYRVWHYSNWGKFEDKLVQLREQLCEINNRLGYGSKPVSQCFIEERKNMGTTEENYIEKINSISKLEWSPLLNLIPVIERTQNFGEVKGGDKLREGLFTMPYMSPSRMIYVSLSCLMTNNHWFFVVLKRQHIGFK